MNDVKIQWLYRFYFALFSEHYKMRSELVFIKAGWYG